eukprot:scaffold117167_cov33-Phaeocystis_antarctica.AAC.2
MYPLPCKAVVTQELGTETIDILRQVTTHTNHVAHVKRMPYGPHTSRRNAGRSNRLRQQLNTSARSPCATGQHTTARGTSSSPTTRRAEPAGTVLVAKAYRALPHRVGLAGVL